MSEGFACRNTEGAVVCESSFEKQIKVLKEPDLDTPPKSSLVHVISREVVPRCFGGIVSSRMRT